MNFKGSSTVKKWQLINSSTVFTATLIVVPTLTLIIYITGLSEHRSLYLNSLLSTTILSVVFLTFITTGLYRGWKLKDTIGNFLHRFERWKKPNSLSMDVTSFEPVVLADEGIEGCLISFAIWIIVGLFGAIIFWFLGAVIWAVILVTAGLLYWIIFRAFRLIFRHSSRCSGDFRRSILVAILFTILYNSWIYTIIVVTHFLNR